MSKNVSNSTLSNMLTSSQLTKMTTGSTEATESGRTGSYLAVDPRGVMVSPHPWRKSWNCFRVEMLLYGEQVIIDDVLTRGDVTMYHLSKGGWVSRMSRGGKLQLAQYDEYQIEGTFVVVQECNLFRDPVPGMFCYPTKCIPKNASFCTNLKCVVETRKGNEVTTFYLIHNHPLYSGWVPAENVAPAQKVEGLCSGSFLSLDHCDSRVTVAENTSAEGPRLGVSPVVDDRHQSCRPSARVKGEQCPKVHDYRQNELGDALMDSRELTPRDKKLPEIASDGSMTKKLKRSARRNLAIPVQGVELCTLMTNTSEDAETKKKKKMEKKKTEKKKAEKKMDKKLEKKGQLSTTATTDPNIEDLDAAEDTRLARPPDPEPSRSQNSSPRRNAPGMSRSHHRRNSRNRDA